MQNKKDNFLEKIIKKNYNNELEKILEEKNFEENAKNLLLNILYKIETSYKDYENVKRNVMPKDKYIQNIISIIYNKCNEIQIINPSSVESKIIQNKTFFVDKQKNKIICFPIERKLLYCISKISKNEEIIKEKYFLIYKTLSDMINIGNNIDTVEPLRDFNGFSWTSISREIESIYHNIIYQNLRILVGYEFINNWINNKEYIIDYMELFIDKLNTIYGKENQEKLIKLINNLSILLAIKFNEEQKQDILKVKQDVDNKLFNIKDKQLFIITIDKEKKELDNKIKNIDTIINNKQLLQNEYIKRNEKLQLENKIFSMRVLRKIMLEERDDLILKLEELNNLLNPQKFLKYKQELENKQKYLKIVDSENIELDIQNLIIQLQKNFLECFLINIKNIQTKNDIIDLIYQFRYYIMIPYNENYTIGRIDVIKEYVNNVQKSLINKAIELKLINSFSQEEDINYNILKNIFYVRIIRLEDLYINIQKDKNELYIQLFDENMFEEKVLIDKKDKINIDKFEVKLNKKIKIFN